MLQDRLKKYAELIVKCGLNVQNGQEVIIRCGLDFYPLCAAFVTFFNAHGDEIGLVESAPYYYFLSVLYV